MMVKANNEVLIFLDIFFFYFFLFMRSYNLASSSKLSVDVWLLDSLIYPF